MQLCPGFGFDGTQLSTIWSPRFSKYVCLNFQDPKRSPKENKGKTALHVGRECTVSKQIVSHHSPCRLSSFELSWHTVFHTPRAYLRSNAGVVETTFLPTLTLTSFKYPYPIPNSRDLFRFKAGPLEAILVVFGRRFLNFFLFERSWKNMTPLLCSCEVVNTLETRKCQKKGTSLRRN